ncbi:MAG: hypothetical protein ABJA37_02360 [Ferruginibacter sp.]
MKKLLLASTIIFGLIVSASAQNAGKSKAPLLKNSVVSNHDKAIAAKKARQNNKSKQIVVATDQIVTPTLSKIPNKNK